MSNNCYNAWNKFRWWLNCFWKSLSWACNSSMILTLETSQDKPSEETRHEWMRAHITHSPWRSIVEGVIVDTEREQQPIEHRENIEHRTQLQVVTCSHWNNVVKDACFPRKASEDWYFTEAHSGVSRPSSGSNRRIRVAFFLATSLDSLNQNQGGLIQFLVFFCVCVGGVGNFVYELCMYNISALLSPNTSIPPSQIHDFFLVKILWQLLQTEDFRIALWLSSDYLYWLKRFCGLNSLFNQTSIYDPPPQMLSLC